MYWNSQRILSDTYHGQAYAFIRRQVRIGTLLPGEQLPAERKLAETLGMARATLRDALKRLEGDGYVVTVRGKKGGHFVSDERAINGIARTYLLNRPDETWRSFEYLSAILTASSALVCGRRSPSDLRSMRGAVADVADADTAGAFRHAQYRFLTALCAGALNPFFVDGVEVALENLFFPNPDRKAERRSRTLEGLFDHVASADAGGASSSMDALLDEISEDLLFEMMRGSQARSGEREPSGLGETAWVSEAPSS